MMDTLLLDRTTWDLLLDANGNIAMATAPYALAQDGSSAVRTFQGECYYDTTVGLPYLTQIFGKTPSLPLLRAQIEAEAETVPGTASADVFFTTFTNRLVMGQLQMTSSTPGQAPVAAPFTVINPIGV